MDPSWSLSWIYVILNDSILSVCQDNYKWIPGASIFEPYSLQGHIMLDLKQAMIEHGYTHGKNASARKLAQSLLEIVPDMGTLDNVSNQIGLLIKADSRALTWWTDVSREPLLESLCGKLELDMSELLSHLDPTRKEEASYEVWPAGTSAILRPFIHGFAVYPPLELKPNHVGKISDRREQTLLHNLYGPDASHKLSLEAHKGSMKQEAYYPFLPHHQTECIHEHELVCFDRATDLLKWMSEFLRHDARIDMETCFAWIDSSTWRPDGLHDWCMILSFLHHAGMKPLDIDYWCSHEVVTRSLLVWLQGVCPFVEEQAHEAIIQVLCQKASEALEDECIVMWTEEEYEDFSHRLDHSIQQKHDIRDMSRRILHCEDLSRADKALYLMKPGELLFWLGVVSRTREGYELSHFFARRILFGLWHAKLISIPKHEWCAHVSRGLAIPVIHEDVRRWFLNSLLDSPTLDALDRFCPQELVGEDVQPELYALRVLDACVLEVGCAILCGEIDDDIPPSAWPRLERLHDALCKHLFLIPAPRLFHGAGILKLVSIPERLWSMFEQKPCIHEHRYRLMCMLALTWKISQTTAKRSNTEHTPIERLVGEVWGENTSKTEYVYCFDVFDHIFHCDELLRWHENDRSEYTKVLQWLYRFGEWTLNEFGEIYKRARFGRMVSVQRPVYLSRLMIKGYDALGADELQHLPALTTQLLEGFNYWIQVTPCVQRKTALETFWKVLHGVYKEEEMKRPAHRVRFLCTLVSKLYPGQYSYHVHELPDDLRRQIHQLGFWTELDDAMLSTVLDHANLHRFAQDASHELQNKLLHWMTQSHWQKGTLNQQYQMWLLNHQGVVQLMDIWLRGTRDELSWLEGIHFLEQMWARVPEHLWQICLDLMEQESTNPEGNSWHLRNLLYSMPEDVLNQSENGPLALLGSTHKHLSKTMCAWLRWVCVQHLEKSGPRARYWFDLLQRIQHMDRVQT